MKITVTAEDGSQVGSHVFDQKTNGGSFSVHVAKKQFYSSLVEAANTPKPNTSYQLRVTYTAPQSL
jgi:hypothetical protein